MVDIEKHTKKIFYTMGEVAEMFDVNTSLIRFWEQKFDVLKPKKNKKGNRLFSPEDVDNLKIIYHLVKEKGMTLSGAQKRMKQNPDGESHTLEVVEKLQNIRSLLLEVRQEIGGDRVNDSDLVIKVSEPDLIRRNDETAPELIPEPLPVEILTESNTVSGEMKSNVSDTPAAEKPRIIEQTLF